MERIEAAGNAASPNGNNFTLQKHSKLVLKKLLLELIFWVSSNWHVAARGGTTCAVLPKSGDTGSTGGMQTNQNQPCRPVAYTYA